MTTHETLHFTLGENTGALLAQIAQEHLVYNSNVNKAVEAITQSLIGVSTDLAIKILKGDIVLFVEDDQFLATEYDPEVHSKIFSRLDCVGFATHKLREIANAGQNLYPLIDMHANRSKYDRYVNVDLTYESVFDFIGGDKSTVLREIMDNHKIEELERLILTSKAYLETASNDMAVIHFMKTTWPEDFDEIKDDLDYRIYADEAKASVTKVADSLSRLFNSEYIVRPESPSVKAYIESAMEIDEVIKNGIEPVNIMDNYSAGWLSPDGEYYALNGEIANMLHNQIADALLEKGIIPDTEENRGNPDNWLQAQGWVRIHGNLINFEAHMNERINRGQNRFMTDKQVDTITQYCRLHHGEIVKVFFQPISALMFQQLAKHAKPEFYKKYLNW